MAKPSMLELLTKPAIMGSLYHPGAAYVMAQEFESSYSDAFFSCPNYLISVAIMYSIEGVAEVTGLNAYISRKREERKKR